MPDSDKMMYQTPFFMPGAPPGVPLYAAQQEAVTHGMVDRCVMPRFDSARGGSQEWTEWPPRPDPSLLAMGCQPTGQRCGPTMPGHEGVLYRCPQSPVIGQPAGLGSVGGRATLIFIGAVAIGLLALVAFPKKRRRRR